MDTQEAAKRLQEEANGMEIDNANGSNGEPAVKRVKLDDTSSALGDVAQTPRTRPKGVAPIKEE
jgi:tRNA-dihydrouridine synthase 3